MIDRERERERKRERKSNVTLGRVFVCYIERENVESWSSFVMGQKQGKDASSSVTAAGGNGSGKPPPPCGYGEAGGSNESASCPVDLGPSTSGSSPVYNVYNQRIDQQVATSEASKEEAKFRSIWNLAMASRDSHIHGHFAWFGV